MSNIQHKNVYNKHMKLLSREQFRTSVLSRQKGKCCVPDCEMSAVDAHHILNRNLFTEEDEFGGYFFENGAQLCADHHLEAELTLISPEQLRKYCEIDVPAIPHSLNPAQSYDCWGNHIVSEWVIIAGPLFNNEGCQKALKRSQKLWRVQESEG